MKVSWGLIKIIGTITMLMEQKYVEWSRLTQIALELYGNWEETVSSIDV